MAKALLGYVGGSDPRLLAEMRRLQQRVQDLESELVRMQAENDALSAAARQRALPATASEVLGLLQDAGAPYFGTSDVGAGVASSIPPARDRHGRTGCL